MFAVTVISYSAKSIVHSAIEMCQSGFLSLGGTRHVHFYGDDDRVGTHVALVKGIGCFEERIC